MHSIFNNKSLNKSKLAPFGFKESNGNYVYSTHILDGQFEMIVSISSNGDFTTNLIDTCTYEPYNLHLVESAIGTFVGTVRSEYEQVLTEIAENCFYKDIFKSVQAHKVITYIRETYNDELEFLWEKFSSNAIWRRNDNKKWYALLIKLSKSKLGLQSDELTDIIDLRAEPETITTIVDNKKYFPGYHMNKKHWITLCLDNSIPTEEIFKLIDKSYELAKCKYKS